MKTISLFIMMGVVCAQVLAQKHIEKTIPVTKNQQVNLDFDFADSILIKGWDKPEVKVNATVNINNNSANDNFELNVIQNSDQMSVVSEIRNLKKLSRTWRVKDDETGDSLTIRGQVDMDIWFEVYVPRNINIKMKTISGDIQGKNLTGELKWKTISGDIDFWIPEKASVNLDLGTITGEMYSDLNIANPEVNDPPFINQDFHYSLNGGKVPVKLETISGNIYLRKE